MARRELVTKRRNAVRQSSVEVADLVRRIRNHAAHPTEVELTAEVVPTLDRLMRTLLDYVYGAPLLVQQAREQLGKLEGDPRT